ncbi:hypothetical protein AbraIFM66950_002901 [Aspergillus brasiliensis]|nr:hypothetical protein AbraIFM66950_002901 [Aspergillus brasiliensis]
MAPILLSNNLRTPFKSLNRIIHLRKGKGKDKAHPDLSSALTRLFANADEDDDEESSTTHITEPTPKLLVEGQDPALITLLHTLTSTKTTSTSDSSTLFPLLTSTLDTLSTCSQNQKVNTLPIYTALLRHLDTYTSYLIWDHEILLTDADIICTASTALPTSGRSTSEYRHNIIRQMEAAYLSNYETCKALLHRLSQIVDMEILGRAEWVFPRQTGWVEVRKEVIRLRETLEEIRWTGKLKEVEYVDY